LDTSRDYLVSSDLDKTVVPLTQEEGDLTNNPVVSLVDTDSPNDESN